LQFSHSRVETFMQCPFKYKMRYIDKLKTIAPTNADNPLILGRAIHTGIEEGVDAGIKAYYDSFPIAEDAHITEAMKLEHWIPKVRAILPEGGKFEEVIQDSDFIGYMDYLVPTGQPFEFDLYDYKYSNNVKNYIKSGQLHEYKYFFERNHIGQTIRNMYFVFIPKVSIKQKKTEDIMTFRRRVQEELTKPEIQVVEIGFNYVKVVEFGMQIKTILECESFEKDEGYLCNWCEYQEYCESGVDYMLLPKNERKPMSKIVKKAVWVYGSPFSGKSTIANDFPEPLFINTDGNLKFLPGGEPPKVEIVNRVLVEGRQTKVTLAWEVFKEAISELEKKQNDFETIVVDLLEDVYEHCRIYIYQREGITHESDNSFKYYDIVRTEFLSTLKRLVNLDYNIVLISHEDTSKDITKKSGDKITSISPNLPEKVAKKVAGMVDIVARVVADGDERTLSFKTNEVIFGGGRLTVTNKEIPLDYDAFMEVYQEANTKASGKTSTKSNKDTTPTEEKPTGGGRGGRTSKKTKEETPSPEVTEEVADESSEEVQEVEKREADSTEQDSSAQKVQEPEETEQPKPRTRRKRGE
jgi:phage nucleotide-binding protein